MPRSPAPGLSIQLKTSVQSFANKCVMLTAAGARYGAGWRKPEIFPSRIESQSQPSFNRASRRYRRIQHSSRSAAITIRKYANV